MKCISFMRTMVIGFPFGIYQFNFIYASLSKQFICKWENGELCLPEAKQVEFDMPSIE